MRHTYYGNLAGRFEGSGFRLFLRGLPMWLLVMGPLIAALALPACHGGLGQADRGSSRGRAALESFINQLEGGVSGGLCRDRRDTRLLASVSAAMAAMLFPVFQAMMLRWWLSGLRFGGLTITRTCAPARSTAPICAFSGTPLLFTLAAGRHRHRRLPGV